MVFGHKIWMKMNHGKYVVHHVFLGDDTRESYSICELTWYLPHYTLNIHHQTFLREHFSSRAQTKLSKLTRSVFVKNTDAQDNLIFDPGVMTGIDVPFHVIVVFENRFILER